MTDQPPAPAESIPPTCSRQGCRAPATWVLVWNNPKVHTPERRKTWSACDEHREYLTYYLDRRTFLIEVVARDDWEARTSPQGPPS
ncbi:MAG TPA: hypothetical protein VLC50_03555 [Actinomycetes bacterium]|nr:hypothetical protein [Actinomycetes bacterium]